MLPIAISIIFAARYDFYRLRIPYDFLAHGGRVGLDWGLMDGGIHAGLFATTHRFRFILQHSWTAVGLNFLLSCMALQWSILTVEFFKRADTNSWTTIEMDIKTLIEAGERGSTIF